MAYTRIARRLADKYRRTFFKKGVGTAAAARMEAIERRILLTPMFDMLGIADVMAMEGQMTSNPIDGSDGYDFWPTTYFLYKTSAGRYGKLQINQLYTPSNPTYAVKFVTFTPTGGFQVMMSGVGMYPDLPYDLDTGAQTSAGADMSVNLASLTSRQLVPLNGAKFCLGARGAGPEMDLEANGQPIASGSASPDVAHNTDFGGVSTSLTLSYTIRNTGAQPLSLTGSPLISISGADAGDFSVVTQPASTIDAGSSTAFAIQFTPSAMGLRTATVTIRNNDADGGDGVETAYSFNIQGTGQASSSPEMDVAGNGVAVGNGDNTPSAADNTDFGLVSGNSTKIYVITNNGTGTLALTGTIGSEVAISGANASDFTVVQQPSRAIASGEQSTFSIRFAPSAPGLRTATVTILNNDADGGDGVESPYTFAIRGTGPAPEMDVLGNGEPIACGATGASAANYTDFGTVSEGLTRTYAIVNSGGAALNLTGTVGAEVAISGANASDFTVVQQPARSIAAGEQSAFSIRFAPSAPGPRTATVTILNNDGDGGDGVESPYTFTIQGTGASAPPFAEIAVTGNGSAIACGDLTPSAGDYTDFGTVGSNATYSYLVRNSGTGTLTLSGAVGSEVVISGTNAADFTVVQQPAHTIAAGAQSTFSIRFAPSAPGLRTATVSILNDDADGGDGVESPYVFAIQGTGAAAPVAEIAVSGGSGAIVSGSMTTAVSNHTDFGTVGSSATLDYVIRNTGTGTLTLTGAAGSEVVISGANAADFTVVQQPARTIAVGAQSTFNIRFAPSAPGLRTATVTILNNDADGGDGVESPYTFKIQGTGQSAPLSPEIGVYGNGLLIAAGSATPSEGNFTDFGLVSGSQQMSYVIHNSGTAVLHLTGGPQVSISGANASDFAVVAQPAASIVQGGQGTFSILFTPSAPGLRTATVSILNDDADGGDGVESPYTFAIQGTGREPQIGPEIELFGNDLPIMDGSDSTSEDDNTDFGTVLGSATLSYLISNNGDAPLMLTGAVGAEVVISGANAGDFTVVQQPSRVIGVDQQSAFSIRFTPTAPGLRTATVTILNNDADGDDGVETAYSFVIEGTGAMAAPAARVQPKRISGKGNKAYVFTVIYSGPLTIDGRSIDNSDILVTGPRGFKQFAKVASKRSSADGKTISVAYKIAPPNGGWSRNWRGTYKIQVRAKQIRDRLNRFVKAGVIGTFTVDIKAR